MKYLAAGSLAFVVLALIPTACGGGSMADWADLPDHLSGGVVIYGDSRNGHSMHRCLVDGMASITPEAVFHTGDLVTNGLVAEQWFTFNNIVSLLPSGTPTCPALGNHEYESQLYFDNFDRVAKSPFVAFCSTASEKCHFRFPYKSMTYIPGH